MQSSMKMMDSKEKGMLDGTTKKLGYFDQFKVRKFLLFELYYSYLLVQRFSI
jgi:hypothetical protein